MVVPNDVVLNVLDCVVVEGYGSDNLKGWSSYICRKVGDRSQGRLEGSLFISYYTEV